MSATPGAKDQYSRGSGGSGGGFDRIGPPSKRRTTVSERGGGGVIIAGALLGALLLCVAEFTTLFHVHVATSSAPIKSVTGGSNHSYAMIPIALLAAGLGVAAARTGSRTALVGVGVLGLVALLIALVGDLPNAQATGLAGSARTGYVNASSTPSAGLYMETLGAIVLIGTCGLGLMMFRAPKRGGSGGSGVPDPQPLKIPGRRR